VKDGRAGELVARKLKKLKGANAAISKLKLTIQDMAPAELIEPLQTKHAKVVKKWISML
jgi:hypothetical protein